MYEDDRETVRFEFWEPGASISVDASGGAEIFVLEGIFIESGDELRQYSWLRVPVGTIITAKAGIDGAYVWIKSNHLRNL